MEAEAIETIQNGARWSERTDIEVGTGELAGQLIYKKPGGGVELHELTPGPIQQDSDSLDDFVASVLDPELCPKPEVLVGHSMAVAYCDRAERRGFIRYKFPLSDINALLEELSGEGERLMANGMDELFRIRLRDGGEAVELAHNMLRQYTVATKGRQTQSVRNSGSSYEQASEEEVPDLDLPEFKVRRPLLVGEDAFDSAVPFDVLVFTTNASSGIRLCLPADEYERVRAELQDRVRDFVRKATAGTEGKLSAIPVRAGEFLEEVTLSERNCHRDC